MANPSPFATQRNNINMGSNFNYTDTFDYQFINFMLPAFDTVSPELAPWDTINWTSYIDASGFPNPVGNPSSVQTIGGFGGRITVPKSADYSGNYVLTWTGDASIEFLSGTWTVNAGLSSNYSQPNGAGTGKFSNTTGLVPRIVVQLTNIASGQQSIQWRCRSTDPTNTGTAYFRNPQLFQSSDEARLLSGKIFRLAYLQELVDLNPGCIRFMNWIGGNKDTNCRWESRRPPNYGGYSGETYWAAGPVYPNGSGGPNYVAANQYTLAAATPTTANPQNTPASMLHGEICTTRIQSAPVHVPAPNVGIGVNFAVTGITQQANGVVTTSLPHGFAVGDTVFHRITGVNQMTQLHLVPCVITSVPTTTTYAININTTGFTAWTGATATGCANQYITLQVGSGNDRTAYPIMFNDGVTYASEFGTGYLAASGVYTFHFDKNMVGSQTTGGVKNFGVWLVDLIGGNNPTLAHNGGVPIEIMTQLVIEANLLSQSQGITNPIHAWMCVPHRGLLSIDPDYTTASSWGRNAVDVVLNGSTVAGVTYPGLKSINGPSLIVEFSNETWNVPQHQQQYCNAYGKYFMAVDDNASATALRSTCMARDIKALFPAEPRLKFSLGGQGGLGYSSGNLNGLRALGTTAYFAESHVVSGSWGTPISNHDAFHHASYFDPPDDYFTLTGANSFQDDRAMYFGNDNSGLLAITGSASGTTFTTTAVTNGPPTVGQMLTGSGITIGGALGGTFITAASGSGNVWTLTLNQAATTSAATVHSVSGGSNYIGAADQATALQNFVNKIVTPGSSEIQVNTFCAVASPTAGLDFTFSNAMAGLGKTSIQYEGGLEANMGVQASIYYLLITALYNSTPWKVAQLNYFNARAGLASTALPSIYYGTVADDGNGNAYQRWAYASPDSFASNIEGQALRNNPTWAGMGARNQAFGSESPSTVNISGFSVIHGHAKRHTKMIGY